MERSPSEGRQFGKLRRT